MNMNQFSWPLPTHIITQVFGVNKDVYSKFGMNGHNGIDFRAAIGTPVTAVADGKIQGTFSDPSGYGLYVRMVTKDNFELTYGHFSKFAPQLVAGTQVKAGDLLGYSGNTGFSTGPHLHFGVRKLDAKGNVLDYSNGYKGAINPLPFFMTEPTPPPQNNFTPEQIDALKWHSAKKFSSITDPVILREPIQRIDYITSMYRYHIDLKAQLAKQNIIIE